MARDFAGATSDRLITNLASNANLRSYAAWVYRTGAGGTSFGRVWAKDTLNDTLFNNGANYTYLREWSGGLAQWTFARPADNEWHHIVLTYDSSATTNDPVAYVDGESVTVTETTAPSGSRTDNALAFLVGGESTQTANFAGRLAEFVVYDRILNANEARALYRRGPLTLPGWVRYVPVWGIASPEPEFTGTGAVSATVAGATFATHAPTRLLTRMQRATAPVIEEAAAGGVPRQYMYYQRLRAA